MPRFNSLQEFDEWRRGQGLSSVRETTPKPEAPSALAPLSNGTTAPMPAAQTESPAMSMGRMPPMPGGSLIMRLRRLIPILTWVTAAIAVWIIWSLFAPFTAAIATWISSNIVPLGAAILAIVIVGYVVVLHHHVHQVLPQDILTLRADVMRRLDIIEASQYTSGTSTASREQTTIPSQEHTTTIRKEFEQWMQSEQPTPSP